MPYLGMQGVQKEKCRRRSSQSGHNARASTFKKGNTTTNGLRGRSNVIPMGFAKWNFTQSSEVVICQCWLFYFENMDCLTMVKKGNNQIMKR